MHFGGSESKESACSAGDLGSIPGLGRSPGEGNAQPLPYSCLENPHGQRSLVGYSPQDSKELDTTEQQKSMHLMNRCCLRINKHVRKDDPMYSRCQSAYFAEIEAKKKKKGIGAS